MKAIFRKKKKQSRATETPPQIPSDPALVSRKDESPVGPSTTQRRSVSKARENASELVEQFFGLGKEISEAAEILGPLKAACALLMRASASIRTAHNNQTDWIHLCEDLEIHLAQMEAYRNELQETLTTDDNGCLIALKHYISVTGSVMQKASARSSRSDQGLPPILKSTSTAQTEKEDIAHQRERLDNAWQVYSTAMGRLVLLKTNSITNQLNTYHENHEGITAIRHDDYGTTESDTAVAYGDRVDLCEEGTRVEILESIEKWADDLNSQVQIFWLNDAAGTGKSTIAATMTTRWLLKNRLGGRFFFSPNSRTTQTTREFCRIVAEDIARNQPSVASFIRDAIQAMSSKQNIWFEVQMQRLIIEPIRQLEGDGNVFLVVDALDNCELSEERSAILYAIIQHLPSVRYLKILLTSRPVQDIVDILSPSPLVHGTDIQLLNIQNSHHPDVTLFVEKKLKHIPSEDRAMVIARSGGLFLYAATVCRILERTRHRLDILNIISDVGVTDKLEHRMDILYLSVLKQALVDRGAGDMMLSVLAMIIVAYQPLSSNTIRRLLPKNDYVEEFVQDLGGVLKDGHPDRPIKVLHPTFREFILSNEDRANGFLLQPRQSASEMANACIAILEQILEDDMLHLDRPGRLSCRNKDVENVEQLIQKRTTPAERYASAFWAHHVAASEMSPSLLSRVIDFLAWKLLNWIELMSWRGSISLCIEGLSRLRREAWNQALEGPNIQSYRDRYHLRQPKIITSSVTEWEEQMILGGHSKRLIRLIFSPDGSRLISIGLDGVLQLWSTETGALVGKPFRGMEDPPGIYVPQIRHCTFSADGQRFAFFNCPNEVHIRYSTNGEPVIPHWECDLGDPFSFSLTMSSVLIAKKFAIEYRILQSGQETRPVGVDDEMTIRDCALSPNGQTAVLMGLPTSVAEDKAKGCRSSLWDLRAQRRIASYQLTGSTYHYNVQSQIVFSPDSTRFAMWSSYGYALLCDAQNGDKIEDIENIELTDGLSAVLFCPKSRYLAYALRSSQTIVLRETRSGKETLTIKGDASGLLHLSFSPDGSRLASVTLNQMVRVWSVEAGNALTTIFAGYTGYIRICGLSANWNQFASSTFDQIRLYNLEAGAVGQAVPETRESMLKRRMRYAILGVAHSGPLIAIRSQSERGVEFWDTVTGTGKGRLLQKEYIISVAFSPDGQMIAILDEDSNITIWDAITLKRADVRNRGVLDRVAWSKGENGRVLFSPDSSFLSAYHIGYAFVWYIRTMVLYFCHVTVQEQRAYNPVIILAFSHDSERMAGVDSGNRLYVWYPKSDKSVQTTIPRYYGEVSAAFSPIDSSLLAFACPEGAILWRIGEELQMISKLSLPEDNMFPSFSSDARYFACGRLCWDITSLPPVEYKGDAPPDSFSTTGLQAHSFLHYKDGWICSAFPETPLLPLPTEFRMIDLVHCWHSFGERVIFMNKVGEPILVDCSSLLAEARMK
ncbi:hypothetical protein FRC17_000543 [Serendipita sp. 399]|nr:hypothetical protein FRC17_000543 [Serendipita sp. 399]